MTAKKMIFSCLLFFVWYIILLAFYENLSWNMLVCVISHFFLFFVFKSVGLKSPIWKHFKKKFRLYFKRAILKRKRIKKIKKKVEIWGCLRTASCPPKIQYDCCNSADTPSDPRSCKSLSHVWIRTWVKECAALRTTGYSDELKHCVGQGCRTLGLEIWCQTCFPTKLPLKLLPG